MDTAFSEARPQTSLRLVLRRALRTYVQHLPLEWGKGRLVYLLHNHLAREGEREIAPTRVGKMLLDVKDVIQRRLYYFGDYEPELCQLLEQHLRPGSVFVDCGANCGTFTLLGARLGAEVHSFEPDADNFHTLGVNLALNHLTATINQACVGDTKGEVEFFINDPRQHNRGRHTLVNDGTMTPVKVHCTTLDDYCSSFSRLDVLKMDVEGAELRVLRGAERLLRRLRPMIIFEAHEKGATRFGSSAAELKKWLIAHQYSLSRLTESGLVDDVDPDSPEEFTTIVAHTTTDPLVAALTDGWR